MQGKGKEGRVVLEAVKVALDPSPVQERLLLSHAGTSRFAYPTDFRLIQGDSKAK